MTYLKTALLASVAALGFAGAAHASIYNNTFAVTVSEGLTGGNPFNTTGGNPFSGFNTASASFTFQGPLNFNNSAAQNFGPTGDLNSSFFPAGSISGYSGSGQVNTFLSTTPIFTTVADYSSLAAFRASSGSAGDYKWGSYYTFNLGDLAAGTVLTITHDDGISLYEGNTRVGNTVSGSTSKITETVVITSNSPQDVILRYSRQNGTPSVLQVSVPEPMSLALVGTGLVGLGLLRRRKDAA